MIFTCFQQSDKVIINEKSENYGFFGRVSHVTIKICKSNINIHRGDIHTNPYVLF